MKDNQWLPDISVRCNCSFGCTFAQSWHLNYTTSAQLSNYGGSHSAGLEPGGKVNLATTKCLHLSALRDSRLALGSAFRFITYLPICKDLSCNLEVTGFDNYFWKGSQKTLYLHYMPSTRIGWASLTKKAVLARLARSLFGYLQYLSQQRNIKRKWETIVKFAAFFVSQHFCKKSDIDHEQG